MGYLLHVLSGKSFGKVSIDDVDLLDYAWQKLLNGYVSRKFKDKQHHYLHRIIMERILNRSMKRGEIVDHINQDPSDNRRENLRVATHSQNHANTFANRNSKSQIKGVYYDEKRKRWDAGIRVNYRTIHLGRFKNKSDAIQARRDAEIKYFGKFANPPDE